MNTRRLLFAVRSPQPPQPDTANPATATGAVSPGFISGARFDPHAYRRAFPDKWMSFLHAFYRDATEVAFVFGVTDRAARDWWEGTSAPRGAVVAMAAASEPEGFAHYVLEGAA